LEILNLAEQSRAKQSKAEQSRAKQSKAEQSRAKQSKEKKSKCEIKSKNVNRCFSVAFAMKKNVIQKGVNLNKILK